MTAELHVLLIGDADHAEFRAAVQAMTRVAGVHTAADVSTAGRMIEDGLRPDVIVIAQHRSGEVPPEAIERLRRLAPLAPCVAIQSGWCEGEGRSGRPLPGVYRVSWRQFEDTILRGLMRLGDGCLPDWAGPATLTPEERLLRGSRRPLPRGRGTVGILSHSAEGRRLLEDICRSGGWSVASLRDATVQSVARTAVGPALPGTRRSASQDGHPTSGACDVVLWDADELPEDLTATMHRLRERVGDANIIVLLGFPRQHDLERACANGLAGVAGKPFAASELLREIDLARSRGDRAARRE